MAGLGGLSQGFMQGFQTFGNYFDRKNQREQQKEQREWQRSRAETLDAQRAQQHQWKADEVSRQNDLRQATALRHQAGRAEGPMAINVEEHQWADPIRRQRIRSKTGTDPDKFLGENRQHTEQAVNWFKQLAQGEDQRRPIEAMNDPRTVESATVLLGELVNENLGETIERDGKTYTIQNKRIASIVPDQTGEGVHIGLKVEAIGPDGEPYEYDAPMTDGHSVNDDLVLDIPLEKMIQRVKGHEALLQGTMNMSPDEVMAALDAEVLRLGGELPKDESYEIIYDAQGRPQAQRNAQGKVSSLPKNMLPSQGTSPWRKLNDGTLFNQDTGETMAAGDGGGGMRSIGDIDQSLIQRTSRQYWGTLNANDQFVLDPGSRDNFMLTNRRAEALALRGVPELQATELAALSITGPLDEAEARRMAEQEASEQGMSKGVMGFGADANRGSFIEQRTQQLMEESRHAQEQYEQIMQSGPQQQARGQSGPQQGGVPGQGQPQSTVWQAPEGIGVPVGEGRIGTLISPALRNIDPTSSDPPQHGRGLQGQPQGQPQGGGSQLQPGAGIPPPAEGEGKFGLLGSGTGDQNRQGIDTGGRIRGWVTDRFGALNELAEQRRTEQRGAPGTPSAPMAAGKDIGSMIDESESIFAFPAGVVQGLFRDRSFERAKPLRDLSSTLQSGNTPRARDFEAAKAYIEGNPRVVQSMSKDEILVMKRLQAAYEAGELN